MSNRKTLKRATAEALFEFAKKWGPREGEHETDELYLGAQELFAQVQYELYGGTKPAIEKDFEFEQLWALVPKQRRVGKHEALRLYKQLRMLEDWPGAEAVRKAYYDAVAKVSMKSQFYGDNSWVEFVPLLETWLRKRRHLDLT